MRVLQWKEAENLEVVVGEIIRIVCVRWSAGDE